jgi:RHS repeat-associated protein
LESTGDVDNNITYAGYQWDEETGLYYLNARMYDPKVARFLQEDTYRGNIRDPLSLNLYTYCNNEPIKFRDPTGHWKEGDSDRPVAVQLALMQVSDEWLAAETKSKKREIEALADEIRKLGLKHPRVQEIIGEYDLSVTEKNFRIDDSDRIIKQKRSDIWKDILNTLEVVDKAKEAEYLKKGYLTPEEWREIRNVSYNLKFVKGSQYPEEIDVMRQNTHGIDKQKLKAAEYFAKAIKK